MNYLSSNIRFLRKRRKISQQQLADDLGVKRSNIAAYETKNVEPRLSLIESLAQYFGVSLEDFIVTDLMVDDQNQAPVSEIVPALDKQQLSSSAVREIEQVAEKVQRMLEGFKVFYEFKLDKLNPGGEGQGDIDNFLVFINHMSEYNQLIGQTLRTGEAQLGQERFLTAD